ncbi:MAG: phosphoethanolamine--lipid A transferase [Steroidobacteraceae bacterium]
MFRPITRTTLALGASTLWLAIYCSRFWQDSAAAMWQPGLAGSAFLGSLGLIVLFLQAIPIMLMPGKTAPRVLASLLFIIASLGAYFTATYGAHLDKEMMRNVFETDPAEVADLINFKLLLQFALLGLLPAALVWVLHIAPRSFKSQIAETLLFVTGGVVVVAICLFSFSASYASYFREHKPLRYLINPGSVVYASIAQGFNGSKSRRGPLLDPGGAVTRAGTLSPRPRLVFLVVGETARAANFQLGGYSRPTNPQLAALRDVFYFDNVTSCGTSTAASLPCMFSQLGREGGGAGSAAVRNLNLLDALQSGGVVVNWLDNNAGCKGVCQRAPSRQFQPADDPKHCPNSFCYDEVLVADAARLAAAAGTQAPRKLDSLVVLHQIGSHGPAYYERYPAEFARFQPACATNLLDRCTRDEVVNAYDNSILYTDHNVAELIKVLRANESRVDTLLIYVSDHGESLGENGIYLHGMPYAFAPRDQKHVPMLLWMSEGWRAGAGIDPACLKAKRSANLSHDNLFHTVMGAFGLRNSRYQSALDLVAACRR